MNGTAKALLVTSGIVHPSRCGQRQAFAAFRRGLRREVGSSERAERSSAGHRMRLLEELCAQRPGGERPDLIALYFHHPRVEPGTVAALCRYVGDGGALLAIHGALASFKGEPAYTDLLGASFAGHQPVGAREMRLAREGAASRGGLPGCVAVTDEVYEHEFRHEVDIWYRWHEGGSSERGAAAVWTRGYAAGRVACFASGHRAAVWRSPGVVEVIAGLLGWLLRREEPA